MAKKFTFSQKNVFFLQKKCVWRVYSAKKQYLCTRNHKLMRNIPKVTGYVLIANVVIYLLTVVLRRYGIDLNGLCGLHFYAAQSFHWWQPITYMFLHANFSHLFFNMFAVWMFAPMIEQQWGARRFSLYYLVCGLGAGLIQELVWALMLSNMSASYDAATLAQYAFMLNTIGASGAVFGILFAFGWLYPDVPMYILFIPVPIRARIFVIIYALIELFAGLGSVVGLTADNVAHFAHLGGLLFGWLLILYWKKTNWREPGELWQQFKAKLGIRQRPESDNNENRFDKFHYHKSV